MPAATEVVPEITLPPVLLMQVMVPEWVFASFTVCVPLAALARQFSHQRFELNGFARNPAIRNAASITDIVCRWLAFQFLPGHRSATWLHCGRVAVRNGACCKCLNCGESPGCSWAPFSLARPPAEPILRRFRFPAAGSPRAAGA